MAFEEFLKRSNEKAAEKAVEEAKPGIIEEAKKELFECIMLYKKGVIEKSEAAKRLGYSLSQIDMMLN